MSRNKKKTKSQETSNKLEAKPQDGESQELTFSRLTLSPAVRHANTAATFAAPSFGRERQQSIEHDVKVLKEVMAQAENGDKAFASQLLAAQAVSLDAIFTELARRSAINMGEHLHASERYMRLALKAQSNCRATLEALSKLHQPREQIVKHVHVNEGGQAVVADQFHQHKGGQNGKTRKQSHATGTTGKGPEVLSQDPQRDGVSISSGKGQEKVQDARRDQSGSA
ncbi:hypothetical protein INR77_01275 [Erythrobacter sp. SCSIO 43205]|uniref:hypothetical protein n=1 Tax=Erythrobacter sp. SCSIO 43205 TaxID=2779361 RepID=UPI001CAA0FCA|nr:hypothetical protein [Erythrobacter sp. SCSIO 43205]UAB78407.1 hypothetical protein INR77_01275 [Erythrobacter sp. SCSIO 43205]